MDIEKEVRHYRAHLKDKVILCNCDDPAKSKFWHYFYAKFKFFGLKKIIATHYRHSVLFEVSPSYKLEYDGTGDPVQTFIDGDGDFRSPECVALLEEADVVVTNPPFSLFPEYVEQLIAHKKKFIILGNAGAVVYYRVFPFAKRGMLWWGVSKRGMEFKDANGKLHAVNAVWYTNLTHQKRNEGIRLYKEYDPSEYPTYDNYDAIEVSKVKDIPKDYDGEMGVPYTFLDRHNPSQFEIVGLDREFDKEAPPNTDGDKRMFFVNGQKKFSRLVIKHVKQGEL